ncbi:hypothetical protein BH11BAC2_BH11BAC2_19720 [soil metagenome]
MRFLFCFLISFFTVGANAQVMFQFLGNKVTTWTYKAGDEFNGSAVNTDFWLTSYPWARHLYCSKDVNYYTENSNFEISNGINRITAKKESITARAVPYEEDNFVLKCASRPEVKNLLTYDYTSGILFSKQKYQYGYFEIRFRTDEYAGLWPAFWLYGGSENEEIDIFEIPGQQKGFFHVDVHCPSGCNNYHVGPLGLFRTNWGGNLPSTEFWSGNYNIIGAEWQPGYIKWYLNGEPVAYWKGKIATPLALIANLAVTSDDGSFSGNPSAINFPAHLDIDYIRVWNRGKIKSLEPEIVFQNMNSGMMLPEGNAALKSKIKPVYKKSQLKAQQQLVGVFRTSTQNIMIQCYGNLKTSLIAEVSDAQGKVLSKTTISKSFTDLPLSSLNKGKYQLTIKSGALEGIQSFEVK